MHADGIGVDRERVLRHCHDLPLPHRGLDDGRVASVLGILSSAPAAAAADPLATGILGADRLPQLYGGLYRWLTASRQPSQGHALVIGRLAALGLTPQPLWALARPAGPPRLPEAVWIEAALLRLARAADEARQDLAGLALTIEAWRSRLGRRRRNSRLDRVLIDVTGMLVATPVTIARRHGLSVRGAAVMLNELAALGAVVEITSRRSWKIFVPADQAITPAAATGRAAPPPPLVAVPDVGPLLAEADAAIARAEAALARSRPRRGQGLR
jgi:hypothetical protein